MKKIFLSFVLLVTLAAAQPRTISLAGTVTNTTGNVTAPAQLEITQDGETIRASIVTLPPLTGTGAMTGRCLDGWCELSGDVAEGFSFKFRGVLNADSFRGTYMVTPKQGQTQYGRFNFRLSATRPAK
ncbi:MAG TPA: hypothetical protein VGM64_13890 [Lacunisphaera sp.]|jgi:hypothetical protein